MIIGENFLFIHTPKSGGMSFTRWLINNVDGRLWVVVPESAFEHSQRSALFDDIPSRMQFVKGTRHETLPEARKLIDELGCPEPEFVFSAIRDPYDLLRSYFNYLKKPHIVKRRGSADRDLELALSSDFETFAAKCNFFERDETEILDYFDHLSSFKHVDAVPLELMSNYLTSKFAAQENFGRYNLEVRNATSKPKIQGPDETRIRSQVYARFGALHKLYKAAHVTAEEKSQWDIKIERDGNIANAEKQSKTEALALSKQLIEQQRKDIANKDLQIDMQRQTLSKTNKDRDTALADLREKRTQALTTRDELIDKLRKDITEKNQLIDKRKQTFISTEKGLQTALTELRSERTTTLTARDELIKKQQTQISDKNQLLETQTQAFKKNEKTLQDALAELREERTKTLAARDELIKKLQTEVADRGEKMAAQNQGFKENEQTLQDALAELRAERTTTLAARDELIKKQQTNLSDKNQLLETQNQAFKKNEKTLQDVLAELREERTKTLAARDELIERLKDERDERGEVLKQRDKDLKRLKAELKTAREAASQPSQIAR